MKGREKLNILIVDDRPENLVPLESLLESPDRNIIKATSGNQALSLMLEYDFALVLLDVQMPEMDGFEIAELMRKADAFQPESITYRNASFEFRIYESVWTEAERMRSGGELLWHAGRVSCPVLAIHGDYDPHPFDGVKLPLEKAIKDFRFMLLEKCGHEPWNEIPAKNAFFDILEMEI